MLKRNGVIFIIILAIFAFTVWTLVPLNSDRFGRQGMRLGLDLVGGVHLVYQAQFSENATSAEKSAAIDRALITVQKRIDTYGESSVKTVSSYNSPASPISKPLKNSSNRLAFWSSGKWKKTPAATPLLLTTISAPMPLVLSTRSRPPRVSSLPPM
jgi:preprotein translocase subunit SecD